MHHIGGRIWILWNPNYISVTLVSMTAQLIHSAVYVGTNSFAFTAVYDLHTQEARGSMWNDLKDIQCSPTRAMDCYGGF